MKVFHKGRRILFLFIVLLKTSLRGQCFQSSVLWWVLYDTWHIHFHSKIMHFSFTVGQKKGHLMMQLNESSCIQGDTNKNNHSDHIKRHTRSQLFNFLRKYYRVHKISSIFFGGGGSANFYFVKKFWQSEEELLPYIGYFSIVIWEEVLH